MTLSMVSSTLERAASNVENGGPQKLQEADTLQTARQSFAHLKRQGRNLEPNLRGEDVKLLQSELRQLELNTQIVEAGRALRRDDLAVQGCYARYGLQRSGRPGPTRFDSSHTQLGSFRNQSLAGLNYINQPTRENNIREQITS